MVGTAVGTNIVFDRSLQDRPAEPEAMQVAREPTPPPVHTPAVAPAAGASTSFAPPAESNLPEGEYGRMVRLGEQIFMRTGQYAKPYVGNDLSCANCHLDAGRKPDSAPLWGAFGRYPAFRNKTGQVDTFAARLQGCFMYSMNGKAPPQDSEIITALQTYSAWLAKGAPVGTSVPGGGYPTPNKPPEPADYLRGEKVYAQNCALCHGTDGQGQRTGDAQVFPPLWGPRSFNWGAGMHAISTAASFIQANMPLGRSQALSDQAAWDVALFMNSHERPQDPRFSQSVAQTRRKFHDSDDSMYGRTVDGRVLGSPR
ncbi:MAG: c-type cytochrome [Proteobacteria bacterium]|nr:c-type cytochrome [Pseudomonadota bacterium]